MSRRVPGELPAPQDRELVTRRTVRVIMVDPQGRQLLFADTDPGIPGCTWWVVPGGGIDPGETEHQAAVREVAEETGCRIEAADLVGPLAHRRAVHGYSDQVVDIVSESFYLVRVPAFEVSTEGHTVDEQLTLAGHRWWSPSDLATTTEWVWPEQLVELTERGLAGRTDCLELGTVEESTLAVDPSLLA